MVVARGHKHPIRYANSVTDIARSSCREVPSRLPPCLDTVVTSRASAWYDPRMSEGRPRPANCPMTTVAAHSRRNMRRRLAYRGRLVIAFGAGSRSYAIVRKKCRSPICRPVAAAAIDRGRQVVRRLKGGDDSSAW